MIRKGIKLPKTLNVDTAVKSDKFSSDMTIEEFLDNFVSYINVKELEGLAVRTIDDYKWNMKYFTYFLEEVRQTTEDRRLVDLDLFRSYMYYMSNEKKLKNTTINIRLRSMKSYLNWLHNEGKLEHNLAKRLKLMKVQDEKVRTLFDREVRKMLKSPDKTTYRGLRTFTIMVLMLDCGPRVSETVNIKVEDVNLKEGIITIRGSEAKSRRYRELPISSKTKSLLKQLIDISKMNKEEYVFLNFYEGGHVSADQVMRDFQKCYKLAGLESKGVHSWRHTFATNFIKNGGNAFTLQRIMGHSTKDMTKKYVSMENKTLKEHHKRGGYVDKFLR